MLYSLRQIGVVIVRAPVHVETASCISVIAPRNGVLSDLSTAPIADSRRTRPCVMDSCYCDSDSTRDVTALRQNSKNENVFTMDVSAPLF